ncbi:hypothetical protein GOZ83_06135 [Agrobacterium vitis]|uniref:hypothetical protein n=1 Tax=Agrobacterium vitis TaxID=373 RepID=UPI0012E946A9|nr:hypothetical protein [Agrobacterium vitis]MVA44660.1 hypothetical protein [Agrobacterium vitis]
MKLPRYFARSASDKAENWPFWFVADRQCGSVNVTGKIAEEMTGISSNGAVFASRAHAEMLATWANNPQNEGESK